MDAIANLDDITNLTDADIMNIFGDIGFDGNNNDVAEEEERRSRKRFECPNCKTADHIINDTAGGMTICSNCAQVLDMLTDAGPENRQFDDDKNETRQMGMPINKLLPQSSLGTTISGNCRGRLKILHSWSAMPYKERSLNIVFKDIQYRCNKFQIVRCVEDDAKIMYKTISECKHLKGKNKGKCIIIRGANRKSLIAACVFFACRRKGMTRSPKEIADIFEIKYTEMTRGCKNFMRLMKLKKIGLNMRTSRPEDFITRFCKELKIKEPYLQQTLKIARNIRKLNIASVHTPPSSATSSILLMAELNNMTHITKRKLANQFKVSEVTITKTYRKLEQFKKALIDDELTDKIVALLKEQEKNIIVPDFVKEKCLLFNQIENDKHNKDIELLDSQRVAATWLANDCSNDSNEYSNEYSSEDYYDQQLDDLDDFDDLDQYGELDILNDNLLHASPKDDINELLNQIDIEICNELNHTDMLYEQLVMEIYG